ncbi:MAG TPA: HDIG domain-containing protein [Thermoplasmatales archaeon]|nr:HDIG domain-containing protein [Thermoplasmatales archaeon]
MLSRDEAISLVSNYIKDKKLLKHSLAVEAIMRALARRLRKDEDIWGLTGLLHDIDYEYTQENPMEHGIMTCKILDGLVPDEILRAIKAHNYKYTNQTPTDLLDIALIAADAVSGLIIATALVMPSKKLSEVKVDTLMSKFKDKSFARRVDRKKISMCRDIGLTLEEFLELSLRSLQSISDELDL